MPHQQRQMQSQEQDPSSVFHSGSYYPFSSEPISPSFPMSHYPDVPYRRYANGMMYNPNHPMYYRNNSSGVREWNNFANGSNSNNASNTMNMHPNRTGHAHSDGSTMASATKTGTGAPLHNTNKQQQQSQNQKDDGTVGSNSLNNTSPSRGTKKATKESDEEAAATALLMAGGPRSENIETMEAAVREKKLSMYNQQHHTTEQTPAPPSGKTVKQEVEDNHSKNSADRDGFASQKREEYTSTDVGDSGSVSVSSNNSNLVVKDFPNVLHEVLTKSQFSGTVLEWLSHGKSWRVLRWDELSALVIPAYFPELCEEVKCEDTESCSTERMNMFIRQIKAWGFKEVREVGPDLGSFQHEFFIKIAPNLCRHMKVVSKGNKRPSQSNIVSPPRRGPKGRFSMHSSPALNPGFSAIPDTYKKRQRLSTGINSPKINVFLEKREEVSVEASSPGTRSGPRCVSFQERPDDDDSPIQSSSYRLQRPPYESPRSSLDMHLNYVSPNPITGKDSISKQSPRLSLRSNRGGSRVSSRAADMDDRISASTSTRGSFPVSNRGRGMRNVSSRGRSTRANMTRSVRRVVEKTEDPPTILKNFDKIKNMSTQNNVTKDKTEQ